MGEDLDQIQMNYLIRSGLQMLGLALISMLAAVLVTFLASRVAALLGHDLRNMVYRKVISFSQRGDESFFHSISDHTLHQ